MLIGSSKLSCVEEVKKKLGSVMSIKDMGEAKHYLGMEIQRSQGRVLLSQQRYTAEILERFGMESAKVEGKPLPEGTQLGRTLGDRLGEREAGLYREITGCLMYLSCCTRPDIAQGVGLLTRAMKEPRTVHLAAAKHLLRYVGGSRDQGIEYGSSKGLVGYADSDHATDKDTRRSTTGYVFLLNGGAVSWKSKLQPTVATSTCEAEYMAAGEAVKEALWLRKMLPEFGQPRETVLIYGDNQSALAVIGNPVASERVKHIDIVHHFTRERVELGEVSFKYC